MIRDDQRLHLELDHDGFAKEQPVLVADDLSRIQFTIENRTGGAHRAGLTVAGLPAGDYTIAVDGGAVATVTGTPDTRTIHVPVGRDPAAHVSITRTTR